MKRLKRLLRILLPLLLIGGVAAGVWFFYDSTHYFTTEDAQITADMISITPEVTGRVKRWQVREGDAVRQGQVLGRQELSMLVSNTALNTLTMAGTADTLANKVEIKSPLDGRVVQSNVIEGQVLSPGMEAAVVADTAHMYTRANIEETDIFRIKPGQAVDIDIDALPGRHFRGYVERIGQATQQAFNTLPSLNTSGEFSKVTQLIPVRIAFADLGDTSLMLGMNATVRIHTRD